MVKKYVQTSKKHATTFLEEFKRQAGVGITAAFAFLIALTWRDFITSGVESAVTSLSLSGPVYLYQLLVAILVTALSVLGILLATKFHLDQTKK